MILETETPSMFKTAMTIIGDVMTYITTSMVTLTKLGQLSYSQDMLLEEYMEIRKVAKKIFDTTEGLKRATHAKIEIVVTQRVLQQSFIHVCVCSGPNGVRRPPVLHGICSRRVTILLRSVRSKTPRRWVSRTGLRASDESSVCGRPLLCF